MATPLEARNSANSETMSELDSEEGSQADPEPTLKQEDEKLQLATNESKAVWMLRIVMGGILVSVAVAVCLSVYFLTKDSETKDFEEGFNVIGGKLVSSFESTVIQRVAVIEAFSTELTSAVNHDPNATWPFYTPPDYEYRAGNVVKQSQLLELMLLPKVATEEKEAWEKYAVENQGWIAEGLAIQEGLPVEEIDVNPIVPIMLTLEDEVPVPETREGPYFPVWATQPASYRPFTNINVYGVDRGRVIIDELLTTKKPTFPHSRDFWEDEDRETDFTYMGIKNNHPYYEGDAFAMSYFPGKNRTNAALSLNAVFG